MANEAEKTMIIRHAEEWQHIPNAKITDLMGGNIFNLEWHWDRKQSQREEYRQAWKKKSWRRLQHSGLLTLSEGWICLGTYIFPKTGCQWLENSNVFSILLCVETETLWSNLGWKWTGSPRRVFSNETADRKTTIVCMGFSNPFSSLNSLMSLHSCNSS